MDKDIFLKSLATIFELNPANLNLEYPLKNNPAWDSLAIISTIAAIDKHYGITLRSIDLEQCNNVDELLNLITLSAETLSA